MAEGSKGKSLEFLMNVQEEILCAVTKGTTMNKGSESCEEHFGKGIDVVFWQKPLATRSTAYARFQPQGQGRCSGGLGTRLSCVIPQPQPS